MPRRLVPVRDFFAAMASYFHSTLAVLPPASLEVQEIAWNFPLHTRFVVEVAGRHVGGSSGRGSGGRGGGGGERGYKSECFAVSFSPSGTMVEDLPGGPVPDDLVLTAPRETWLRLILGRSSVLGEYVGGTLRVSRVREYSFHLFTLTLLVRAAGKASVKTAVRSRVLRAIAPILRRVSALVLGARWPLGLVKFVPLFLKPLPEYVKVAAGGGRS
ncbi:MAG: hypothetical protein ACTSU5_01995 [Promethearchaeota archaeon]